MSRRTRSPSFLIAVFLLTAASGAQETETLYLSGTGRDDAVDWEFSCTEGRRCGAWTRIPVPSQWELHGFGSYNYGHDERKSAEQGLYRHRFRVPAAWRGRTVEIVFEGVMTDAEVRLNGESAGPRHQGAFYPFRHDLTGLLDFDGENLLEVTVSKQSADASVNRAERDADYWVFGGVFRPVYLEASPREAIDHLAVDARHDGAFRLRARLRGIEGPALVEASILSAEGDAVGEPFAAAVAAGQDAVELTARVDDPRPWSAETPALYRVVLELRRGGEVLHRRGARFGFRTVELVPERGLFVNGRRVLLKGVNRHAFWPDSGRTLDSAIDRRDVELMKAMNLNAVRASHYPPDAGFLAACDELGLYVIDELAGWHDAYGAEAGRRLVRAMVERDVNHPSILFWANGNEGGWNPKLDGVFHRHDPQRRAVLRPGATSSGVDAGHYPTFGELRDRLAGGPAWRRRLGRTPPLVLPTEFLHGLYDGGSGAGLADYWRLLRGSPRALGGFLWALSDETVVRTDRDGALDADGNHAPDGVLGPYRELSGSFHALREIFSPVVIVGADLEAGVLEVENRFDVTDLADLRFRWSWVALPRPDDPDPTLAELDGGELPGRQRLRVPPPPDEAGALRLTAFDPLGRDVQSWVLPRRDRRLQSARWIEDGTGTVTAREDGGRLTLLAGSARAVFDLGTGRLLTLGTLALDGPRLVPRSGASAVTVRHRAEGTAHVLEARYEDGFDFVRWTLLPSGWLRLAYQYRSHGRRDFFGVGFPVAPETVEWLGEGPSRIWQNRRAGAALGVWRRERAAATADVWAHEPKFAGFYGGVYWARVGTADGVLTLVLAGDLDLGLGAAGFPADARDAVAAVPELGLTLLNGIAAIGTKFHPASELGPESQAHETDGLYRGAVWLYSGSTYSGSTYSGRTYFGRTSDPSEASDPSEPTGGRPPPL